MISTVVTDPTMFCFGTLLCPTLCFAAFGSSGILHTRAEAASNNSRPFKLAPINRFANISSQVSLNNTVREFEAGSVRCNNILFGDFPGILSCLNAIESIPVDFFPQTIGRRGQIHWDYVLPFRILSCK